MLNRKWLAAATIAIVLSPFLSMPAQAVLDGDRDKGRILFLTKGKKGQACMTCHPGGFTTGEVIRGKKIPSLVESASRISEKKLIAKTLKHLEEDVHLDLTDAQFIDLVTFVSSLPKEGFGSIPAEWNDYVKEKAGK